MLTVHVRFSDAATNQPTAVRARFLGPDGTTYAPLGRLRDFRTTPELDSGGHVVIGGESFVYVDGACEVRLPAGEVIIEAHRGPEYEALRRNVTLGPGQISLRFALERVTDARSDGWYSGDTRCTHLSPHAALLEGAAEDLAVVNLLAFEAPQLIRGLLAFSGSKPCLESPGHLVAVNTLNTHPVLGTVALLDSHRPVYPLRFGDDLPDDWSIADWCDQCHRKRGCVVWPDLPRLTAEHPQGEALAALLLGKIDAFEICRFDDSASSALADWYRLLDCGLRVPLAGGSGKNSGTIALGAVRTFVRLADGKEFEYSAWIDALKDGRTFVTNGPLLYITADGCGPGATLRLPPEGKRIAVRVAVKGPNSLDQIEVIHNGNVIAAGSSSPVELEVNLAESGWLAARGLGRTTLPDGQRLFAHTSPVYVQVEGRPSRPTPESTAPLLNVLDRTLNWVLRQARCPSEKHRDHLADILRHGRARLTG
jgi:hypothetical protein